MGCPPPGHLVHPVTRELTHRFVETIRELGDTLEVVLLQFPPGFAARRLGELTRFLDRLPRDVRIAIELRHRSWWTQETEIMLRERGIAYVYIGQRQGRVNDAGPYPLQPAQMLASPHFHPIYHQDRVWVFEMNR